MRVLFKRNYHVPTGERSRLMYKRGYEYEVTDDLGKAAIQAKFATPVAGRDKAPENADRLNQV
jgi:hypothetical protein